MSTLMSQEKYDKYTNIIKMELIHAMGCTEPICVALTAAKARQLLEMQPDCIEVKCSGNIIKNVKGAVVPHSGGRKGIETAAVLGALVGDADRELEVLVSVTQDDIARCEPYINSNYCKVGVIGNGSKLHVIVRVSCGEHYAEAELLGTHTNIVRTEHDGEVKCCQAEGKPNVITDDDRSFMNIKDILNFVEQQDLSPVYDIVENQITLNDAISNEGLHNSYGANVGITLLQSYSNDVAVQARAAAAAGSDARMSGCVMPVVINSGSGNQGITVSMPVVVYARQLGVSHDRMVRAVLLSNLVAIHQKTKIGRLSAYCGVVSAACGSGAAITYLHGGSYQQICDTITNTLGNIAGMVCDGAKPSCAAKIASAVDAAILGHKMAMRGDKFQSGDGLIKSDIEETISNFGRLGCDGMRQTDIEVLRMMTEV